LRFWFVHGLVVHRFGMSFFFLWLLVSSAICYGVLDILIAGCVKVVDMLHDVGAM